MFRRRIELFKILGFSVRVDSSWIFLATLIVWSFATQVYPAAQPELPARAYWAMGLLTAVGIFVSIILHELAHALVARHYGLEMRGITLFIFGGMAEMEDEPPSAEAELMTALGGPVISILLAGFLGAFWMLGLGTWEPTVVTVLGNLAFLNVLLVAFNAVPAFPLDGGRVLRALLWYFKGSLTDATRIAARVGSLFGAVLLALGVFAALSGALLQGIWFGLIGLFIRGAAQMSNQQLLFRSTLEGEMVSRFMQRDPVTVPRSISVAELVEDYLYRYQLKMFPVVDGDRLLGCVHLQDLQRLPRDEWDRQTVGALAERLGPGNTVAPDTDAMSAFSLMNKRRLSRLMVTEGDTLVGILTLKDLRRFFFLRQELEALGEGGKV